MSSRIFQSVIIQLKEATDRTIGVVDSSGTVVASGALALIGTKLEDVAFGDGTDQVVTVGGRSYKLLSGFAENEYAVFVDGADEVARTICLMAAVAFHEARLCYEEKHDKTGFIKSIISDNILPGEIYTRAKELHFPSDVARAVFLIRQDRGDISTVELLQNLFPDRERDFVVSISENDLVLIKETEPDTESEALLEIAAGIEAVISEELSHRAVIGVGTVARHLRELAERYKEARVAIEVGKVFETEKTVIHYEHLGIGRLIYQLPVTLCEMFLSEIFKKNPIDTLDQETLYTINRFFENSLNVSETSRKLFVHRNTLVYRLEKIKKLTGLDLREFDHAIVFKVALMVKKYLNAQSAKQ